MSVLKSLKSLFFLEDEQAAKTAGAPKPESKQNLQEIVANQAPVEREGKISERFLEVLLQAMEQSNLQGFDYLEYKRSLQSLSKMPMDEPTRYQSAFAMAQTMGVSVPALLDTASHYLKVLQEEERKFGEALANQSKIKIQQREEQLVNLEKLIQSKAEQIKKLTDEIQKHQAELASSKNEISEHAMKMEMTKRDFLASYQSLVGQIQSDVEKMKTHLK
jgi:hypothetical protein